MQVSDSRSAVSVSFDEPNLVSVAGLHELADQLLSVPTDKGANASLKIASLVAGMVAGAYSIDDMALLRHGGMKRVLAPFARGSRS